MTLSPVRDAVIYEDSGGITANGAGEFLLVGRTNQSSGSRRRSVLRFDFSALPAGAVITAVSLRLELLIVSTADLAIHLHVVTAPWTTGASDPSGNESSGAAALWGDTTWQQASFPGTLWNTPGGDHAPAPSATQVVTSAAGPYLWTGGSLAKDGQQWLDQPATNFGWMLRGDELTPQTAKRFVSADSLSSGLGPALIVEYSTIPETAPVNGLGIALFLAMGRRNRPQARSKAAGKRLTD